MRKYESALTIARKREATLREFMMGIWRITEETFVNSHSLLWGVILHKIPAAFVLGLLFQCRGLRWDLFLRFEFDFQSIGVMR